MIRKLPDAHLLESIYLARQLGLDEQFLLLLTEEAQRRGIDVKEEMGPDTGGDATPQKRFNL